MLKNPPLKHKKCYFLNPRFFESARYYNSGYDKYFSIIHLQKEILQILKESNF